MKRKQTAAGDTESTMHLVAQGDSSSVQLGIHDAAEVLKDSAERLPVIFCHRRKVLNVSRCVPNITPASSHPPSHPPSQTPLSCPLQSTARTAPLAPQALSIPLHPPSTPPSAQASPSPCRLESPS
jgi:hypothetical protein